MASENAANSGKTVTVEEYSRKFFAKVLGQGYDRESAKNNLRVAGANFYALLKKLQTAGDREDVKVPLRTLRDEIGNAFTTTYPHAVRDAKVETLFGLFDELNDICTERLYAPGGSPPGSARGYPPGSGHPGAGSGPSSLAPSASAQTNWVILQELRSRVYLLVTGETFDSIPQLRLIALERMHKYLVKEWELNRGLTPSNAAAGVGAAAGGEDATGEGSKKGKRHGTLYGAMANIHANASQSHVAQKGFGTFISHKVVGPNLESWEALFDDLCKASASKLVPLLRGVLSKLYAAELELKDRHDSAGNDEDAEEETSAEANHHASDKALPEDVGAPKAVAADSAEASSSKAKEKDDEIPRKATTGSLDTSLADLLLLDMPPSLPPALPAPPASSTGGQDPFAASTTPQATSLRSVGSSEVAVPLGPSAGVALDPSFWANSEQKTSPPPPQQQPPPPQQQQMHHPQQPPYGGHIQHQHYHPQGYGAPPMPPTHPHHMQQQQPYGGYSAYGGAPYGGMPPPPSANNPFLADAQQGAYGRPPPPQPGMPPPYYAPPSTPPPQQPQSQQQ